MSESSDLLWQCRDKHCGAVLRAAELQRIIAPGIATEVCPRCGSPVVPVREDRPTAVGEETPERPVTLASALVYPFRSVGGLLVLGVGTILVGVIAYGLPFLYGYIITIGVYGCMCNYLFDVVLTTANGEDKPPGLPDFSDWWDDVLQPILLVISTTVLCFTPSILYFIGYLWHCWYQGWVPDPTEPVCAVGVLGLALLSSLYYPMALLAVVMFNAKRAVNPQIVLPSIARVLRPYGLVCAFMILVGLVQVAFRVTFAPDSLFGHFVGVTLKLWGSIASMRLLGLLYRMHKSELAWFG
ncbi:MAG TPA: hypothetical protein VMP11_20995 [Verrucomicrobiae bacterium]|nr:hypothetical protein [Verrucomicrobiae bacterium]